MIINDDGSRVYNTADPYNQYEWSLTAEQFDANGNKTSRTIIADDVTQKIEYFTRGAKSEPNNPDLIGYHDRNGTLIRKYEVQYATILGTDQNMLTKTVTTDMANTGSWNSVHVFFNRQRQIVQVGTVYDTGWGVSAIDAGYFNSTWNYAASVDNNMFLSNFNSFSYYSPSRSWDLDLPALRNYDPLSNYSSSNYTVYKANDFFGTAYTNPFDNINIRDPNGYRYFDYDQSAFNYAPIALDLDGNGIDLASLGHSQAQFDVYGDGSRASTSWTGGNDGLLVIDLSADGSPSPDGRINLRKEISFADWLTPEAGEGVSDLQALKQVFDTDGNSKLDANDAAFSAFRVWQDKNGDGMVQDGELKTLRDWGIRSINLTGTGADVFLPDGTAIHGFSSSTYQDGSTRDVADISFAVARDDGPPTTVIAGYNVKLGAQGNYDVTNLYAPGSLSAEDLDLLARIQGGGFAATPSLDLNGRNAEQVVLSPSLQISAL